MKCIEFVALNKNGREGLKDRVLKMKGASKWERTQFKTMFKVYKTCEDPYTVEVVPRSIQLAKRINPSIFLDVIKKELKSEADLIEAVDYSVRFVRDNKNG